MNLETRNQKIRRQFHVSLDCNSFLFLALWLPDLKFMASPFHARTQLARAHVFARDRRRHGHHHKASQEHAPRRTKVTMQYPEEKWDDQMPEHYRGAPALVRDTMVVSVRCLSAL